MSDDSHDSEPASVSEWIGDLKKGREEASAKIWHRYVEQLVRQAERHLKNVPRRAVAGDDIAQEAFAAFFRGVAGQKFSKLEDRNDLWQVLIMLVDRRAKDHLRRYFAQQNGGGNVGGDSAVQWGGNSTQSQGAGFDNLPAPPDSPESAEALIELIRRSFPQLKDELLQRIALDRAANYSVAEIAERHSLPLRTAERKIKLICEILKEAGGAD